MPKHSIILSSYNRPRYIRRAIASVLEQTNPDFELVIADDGSNEETLEVIRQEVRSDQRCRIFLLDKPRMDRESEIKAAPYRAFENPVLFGVRRMVMRINQSLKIISGDFVHYLPDDDWYTPDRLEIFDSLFKTNDTICVGYGALQHADSDGNYTQFCVFPPRIGNPSGVLDHAQVAHKRRILEKVGSWPLDHGPAPDGGFFLKLSHYWKFHGISKTVAVKRGHPFGLTNNFRMNSYPPQRE